jgi:hypothetical protein
MKKSIGQEPREGRRPLLLVALGTTIADRAPTWLAGMSVSYGIGTFAITWLE